MSLEYCPVCKQKKKVIEESEHMKILDCGHVIFSPILQKKIEPTLKLLAQINRFYQEFYKLHAPLLEVNKRLTEIFANPLFLVRIAIIREDYLTAITLTISIFEIIGKAILSQKLHGEVASERLEKLTVESVIILLRALEIIDRKVYSNISKVQQFRNNNLVHVRSIETLRASLSNRELPKIAAEGYNSLVTLWQTFANLKNK